MTILTAIFRSYHESFQDTPSILFKIGYDRHISLSIYGSARFLLDLGLFFSFLTPWTRDQSVARPLPAHRTAQTQNKRRQTSMPQVGFEPTKPMFERAKTIHTLDCVATAIGSHFATFPIYSADHSGRVV
jgi:hypothetical protein